MKVLVTGAYGRCGTSIIDHLADNDEYDFTYLDREEPEGRYGGLETHLADVADAEAIDPAFERQDAVVHLAGYPNPDGTWDEILRSNVIGTYNALEAAREHEIETFVFASTNHVMGMYEAEFAPDLYSLEHDLVLGHTDSVRPDSFYGASKSFGEDLGRYYVENYEYPKRFYALRICNVRQREYDHPYASAVRGVEDGRFELRSEEYERRVNHIKAMWQSRRDFAHQIECCLRDDTVEFDIFTGVSKNRRRWFDLEHARTRIGYRPRDESEAWNEPPT